MKRAKMNNKGFTLVELIVVLVILAILAAILVPTLLGYIDRAKSEKDYSTAQTVRVAIQSAIAEAYAIDSDGDSQVEWDEIDMKKMWGLVGATASADGTKGTLDGTDITIDTTNSTISTGNQLTKLTLTIGGHTYKMENNVWSAVESNNSGNGGTGGNG